MTIRYFRFTQAEVLAAVKVYCAQCDELSRQAVALAKAFDAKPVYQTGVSGRSFYGIKFAAPLASELWTKASKQTAGCQFPRRRARASLRNELADIRGRWDALKPTMKPDLDAVWKACGTDWGVLILSGVGYVITPDAFYVGTSTCLTKGEEITGGQYEKASSGVKV